MKKKSKMNELESVPVVNPKKFGVQDLFDKGFDNTPLDDIVGRKAWKMALGMVVTNIQRENELSSDGRHIQVINLELDRFATLKISVINGTAKVEVIPTGAMRMGLEDKIKFIIEQMNIQSQREREDR